MFSPLHGCACCIVWHALTCTVHYFSSIFSRLEYTHLFVKIYKLMPTYSSQHLVNIMELLHMTVNHSNVNNTVLLWFSIHNQDIYIFCEQQVFYTSQFTSTNHIQYLQYSLHITRCIYRPCPWSWQSYF